MEYYPELPNHRGTGYPVFLTPIIGSGEKLCVAAIAVMDDGAHACTRAFALDLTPELTALDDLISTVILEVNSYLDAHRTLDGFKSILSGVNIGEGITGVYYDHNMCMRTVLRNHSFLYRAPQPKT